MSTSTMGQEIIYYLKKAMEINVNIGGKAAYESISKNKDKFSAMKEDIQKGFHYIKQKISEKEKKSVRAEHIRIDNQIQNKISDIEDQLEKMNNYLKKNAKAANEKNNKTYQILFSQLQNFKDIVSGNAPSDRLPTNGEAIINFSDLKQGLLEPPPPPKGKKKKESTRIKKDVEMVKMEKDAIKQMEEKDVEIDNMLGKVIDQVELLKVKAVQMGKALDQTIKQIDELDKEVDQVNEGLVSANKDLKNIVEKYKKPSRCCLDITLIITLIGMIAGIIKFSQG